MSCKHPIRKGMGQFPRRMICFEMPAVLRLNNPGLDGGDLDERYAVATREMMNEAALPRVLY